MTDFKSEALEQTSLQKVTHSDDVESDPKGLGMLLDGELSACQAQKRCMAIDGSTIWCLPIVTGPGDVRYIRAAGTAVRTRWALRRG